MISDRTSVNAFAMSMRPKEPFYKWLKKVEQQTKDPILKEVLESDDMNAVAHGMSFLIPRQDDFVEVEAYLNENFHNYLETFFTVWCWDENLWPPLTAETFTDWFYYEINTQVVNMMNLDRDKV